MLFEKLHIHNNNNKNGLDGVTTLRSLCEDIDGDGAGDEKVVDQSRNPAMHCDTLLTNDCSHGTHVASLISGKRPVGYTAAIPDTTAPDTQIAMFKVSVGSLCVNSVVVGDINCNGVEVVTISASSIYFAIDSIIDRKKEYLNGDSDGDPGLNIVALNMSIAGNFIFSSECVETKETGNQVFTASSYIYSTDSNDETLYKYGIAPVVSAGNDRERDGEPIFGCIPRVISVAALNDSFTEVASFSNIAYYTDFIDNGEGVVVAAPGGAFGIINGTSFSSPRVAGHYATLSEKYPSATLDQLTKRLKVSSKLFGDTRINAVHIGARFPQIDIEKALSAEPFIHYDEIPNINIIEDFSADIYTTTEDSLSLKFLSDTSRAYITSTEHFTGEIDATLEIDLITGDQIFSVDIPLKSEVTSKIIINTVDDLTTNADIVSTDFLIIQQVPIVTIEGVIGDNVFTQNENIDGEPIATVVLQPGYSALYGLTTLKRECSDTSITYTQDIPLIGDITLENSSYYRFCVTASHATNVDYTTFTDFLVWHDRDVTGVISDGLLSLDEYNKNIPITDIESLTDYTDTFALTDTSTECDESLTYDTEIYTSENSLFTDSSVQRLCIKASSNFEKSLYTKKDFTVDLKLNVFIVRLKLPRTIVITLNADITSIQETNGDGGFVLTNTSAFSLTPSSYAADKNKIILTFSSDISDDSTLAFTKGSPTLFSSGAVTLESFTSLDVLGFTLDFDLSGDYKSSKDGLFLYLYTQTAYTLNDTALEQFIDGESSLETIKNNIDYYINNQLLDFDLSGEYKSSKDGLFLYIYTQTAYILNDTALEQFIDFNSSLEDTKEKINSSIPT